MTIGTGIFLSTVLVVLAIVAMRIRLPPNWRLVARWSFTVAAVGVVLAGAIIGWRWYEHRPRPISSYAGVDLGMPKEGVHYAKGYPPIVLGDPTNDKSVPWGTSQFVLDTSKFDAKQNIANFWYWEYFEPNGTRTDITFDHKSNRVTEIGCYSQIGKSSCPPLWGISTGSTEDDIRSILGAPDSSVIDTSGAKTMSYAKLSAFFVLTEKRVYLMGIKP